MTYNLLSSGFYLKLYLRDLLTVTQQQKVSMIGKFRFSKNVNHTITKNYKKNNCSFLFLIF